MTSTEETMDQYYITTILDIGLAGVTGTIDSQPIPGNQFGNIPIGRFKGLIFSGRETDKNLVLSRKIQETETKTSPNKKEPETTTEELLVIKIPLISRRDIETLIKNNPLKYWSELLNDIKNKLIEIAFEKEDPEKTFCTAAKVCGLPIDIFMGSTKNKKTNFTEDQLEDQLKEMEQLMSKLEKIIARKNQKTIINVTNNLKDYDW